MIPVNWEKRRIWSAVAVGVMLAAGWIVASQAEEPTGMETVEESVSVAEDSNGADFAEAEIEPKGEIVVGADDGAAAETIVEVTPEVATKDEAGSAKDEPSEAIWTGWAFFESGSEGWAQVGGDGGNAYGRFQLDARHSLAAFLRYAAEANPDFVGLERYYHKSDDKTTLRSIAGLDQDRVWLCAVYEEDFYRVQAEFTYGAFYCLMRDELLAERQIDLSGYGPVLKGTVWSVAVRDGNNLASLRSITETFYPGIGEEEWLKEIYAVEARRHPDQTRRWTDGQREAAMATFARLKNGENVKIYDTFTKDARQDTERIEILSLTGDYLEFVRYTGRKI